MSNLTFFVASKKPEIASYPCCLLIPDDWDDFGHRTLFRLKYYKSASQEFRIGSIKIMHREALITRTKIPEMFADLSEDFCSLGQEIEFYKKLVEVIGDNAEMVLYKLNDAAFNPGVLDMFENLDGFKDSLIRFSEAEKALSEARAIFVGTRIAKMFTFSYRCRLSSNLVFPFVEFNFNENPNLPNNIIALIGNNGTGKTSFLAQMAIDLSGQQLIHRRDGTFDPGRPLFSRVIAVSLSAFDKFNRPKSKKTYSYYYCGIRGARNRLLSSLQLHDANKKAFKLIKVQKNDKLWYDSLTPFLGEKIAAQLAEMIFDKDNYDVLLNEDSYRLSSGQKYLLYVLTQMIAYTREDSLILFDEPETHLHPTATIKLINTIYYILRKTNSYAVIATHSPIILQAIPSSHVRVFERIGELPNIRKLYYECFGGNIERITSEVFNTAETATSYAAVLKELRLKYDYETVLSLFENNLTLNPRTYLYALYNEESNTFSR